MDKERFEELLKIARLSKKDFSVLVDMNYNSVTNWNKSEKIPGWVESWLQNYIKAKHFDKAKEVFCGAGKE